MLQLPGDATIETIDGGFDSMPVVFDDGITSGGDLIKPSITPGYSPPFLPPLAPIDNGPAVQPLPPITVDDTPPADQNYYVSPGAAPQADVVNDSPVAQQPYQPYYKSGVIGGPSYNPDPIIFDDSQSFDPTALGHDANIIGGGPTYLTTDGGPEIIPTEEINPNPNPSVYVPPSSASKYGGAMVTISGILFDEYGNVVGNSSVQATDNYGNVYSTTSRGDGNFDLSAPAGGLYMITPSAQFYDFPPQAVNVYGPVTGLVFRGAYHWGGDAQILPTPVMNAYDPIAPVRNTAPISLGLPIQDNSGDSAVQQFVDPRSLGNDANVIYDTTPEGGTGVGNPPILNIMPPAPDVVDNTVNSEPLDYSVGNGYAPEPVSLGLPILDILPTPVNVPVNAIVQPDVQTAGGILTGPTSLGNDAPPVGNTTPPIVDILNLPPVTTTSPVDTTVPTTSTTATPVNTTDTTATPVTTTDTTTATPTTTAAADTGILATVENTLKSLPTWAWLAGGAAVILAFSSGGKSGSKKSGGYLS